MYGRLTEMTPGQLTNPPALYIYHFLNLRVIETYKIPTQDNHL